MSAGLFYRDQTDRLKFVRLLAEQSERFRLRPWRYVLMDNHFHLGLETTEANLSRATQSGEVRGEIRVRSRR